MSEIHAVRVIFTMERGIYAASRLTVCCAKIVKAAWLGTLKRTEVRAPIAI
jgi:hypothetical protein